jgi:hypothetical protein
MPTGGDKLKNWSWLTLVLPFMEQQDIYNQIIAIPLPFSSGSAAPAPLQTKLDSILCPSDLRPSLGSTYNVSYTNYAASEGYHWWTTAGLNTTHDPSYVRGGDFSGIFTVTFARSMSDIRDGTSKTIALAEVTSQGQQSGATRTCGTGSYRGDSTNRVFRNAFFSNPYAGAASEQGNYRYIDGTTMNQSGGVWRPSAAPYMHSPIFESYQGPNSNWPGPDSFHFNVLNCVMADGSVQAISMGIPWGIWGSLNAISDAYPANTQ